MTEETFFTMLAILGIITLTICMTRFATDWSWRRQIAGHHAAEFYIDGSNYRQWRWLDCHQGQP